MIAESNNECYNYINIILQNGFLMDRRLIFNTSPS